MVIKPVSFRSRDVCSTLEPGANTMKQNFTKNAKNPKKTFQIIDENIYFKVKSKYLYIMCS